LHREREAFHAGQEALHRKERTHHAEELAAALQGYEALKAAVGTAAEITSRASVALPGPEEEEEEPPSRVRSKLVAWVVADLPDGEVFGPSSISDEVNRRYGESIRRPANPRMVSTVLRRLTGEGEIRLVQKGTPHHEALYTKG
jgi:hypothetical protein